MSAKRKKTAAPPEPTGRFLIVKKSTNQILAVLDSLTISSQKEAETANEFLGRIKTTAKEVESVYKPEIAKIEAPAKPLRLEMRRLSGLLAAGETSIKEKLRDWILQEQERAAERRQEQIEEDTRRLRKSGLSKSEASLVAQETTPEVSSPALDGLVLADKWEAELDDKPGSFFRLLEAILGGMYPSEYVAFNDSFATQQAIAYKDPSKAPPGVLFTNRGSLRKTV